MTINAGVEEPGAAKAGVGDGFAGHSLHHTVGLCLGPYGCPWGWAFAYERGTHVKVLKILRRAFSPNLEGSVTRFAPHKALKLIAGCKSTFDERVLVRRAGPLPSEEGTPLKGCKDFGLKDKARIWL